MRPEVRMARYLEALERYRGGRLSCVQAAELLGISERHFRQLRDRYEAEGAEGLIDRPRGHASGRRAPVDRIEFVVEQYRTRYGDFAVKHFHEALQAEHGFPLSYTWTKTVLQSRGLVAIVPFAASLREILCIKHQRVVGRDNCVRYEGRVLQIPEQRHRRHFVKATVQVHEYPDATIALFHGPRRLAGYTADGALVPEESQTKSAAQARSAACPVELWITRRVTHNPTGPSTTEADI